MPSLSTRAVPWLLLALPGCGLGRDHADLPELEAIVAAYDQDPGGALVALAALPDPRDQVLAVEALTLRHGGAMLGAGGCGPIPAGPPRQRCQEILDRAHLFSDRAGAPAVEPADREVVRCDDVSSPAQCALQAAHQAVSAGSSDPHLACEQVPTATLRAECAFRVGEALILERGVDGYGSAVAACGQAGPFELNCLEHLSAQLARDRVAGWSGACMSQLDAAASAPLHAAREAIEQAWAPVDPALGERLLSRYAETLGAESLLAASPVPSVPAVGAPPYASERVVLARYPSGGLRLDGPLEGPGAHPARARAARLANLASVLNTLEADVVLVEQLEDPAALAALRDATACLGDRRYPYAQLSPPAWGAGVLSRYPLTQDAAGVGVQLYPHSPGDLVLEWGTPDQPLVWRSERWSPPEGMPGEPSEVRLPFLLDPQGQPMAWNPAAKRGYSDRLPSMLVLVRAAGSPH